MRYHLRFSANTTTSLPVINPGEIQSLFAAWIDLFELILGHPTDTDLTRLREELTEIFLPIPYDVEKIIQNLLALVMYEEDYKQRYCAKLSMTTKPSVYN